MILIVEDDEYKSSKILELINIELATDVARVIVNNVRDAVKFLSENKPSKIILDMSLPSHKALQGQGTPVPLPTGGIEVLFELLEKGLNQLPILILTQYPEIEIEGDPIPVNKSAEAFKKEYGFLDIEACHYDNIDGRVWMETTIKFLRKK